MQNQNHPESGNIIFFILIGIVLIGLVTAAIRSSGLDGANIDREELAVNESRVRQYASELERATVFILTNGYSEEDIRFAHPDASAEYGDINTNPELQIFHPRGGGAEYRPAPSGINDGSAWEFYGHSSLPQVGTSKADLIAVLPNVTEQFCDKINVTNGYSGQPSDTGAGQDNCLFSSPAMRFDDGTQYSLAPNTTDEASFSVKPAMQGCVSCTAGGYHFFHVLHVR